MGYILPSEQNISSLYTLSTLVFKRSVPRLHGEFFHYRALDGHTIRQVQCDAIRWNSFCGDVVLDSINMAYMGEYTFHAQC